MSEGGANWSTGQRQQMCLARAVLKQNKIILLDEATSSVDFETDRLIQDAVRHHFKESTIMTIAHRLSTVADYDKVLVMGDGRVLEYGHPKDLLDNQGDFYQMVQETGPANAQLIYEIASS